jgi:hypothetical protein
LLYANKVAKVPRKLISYPTQPMAEEQAFVKDLTSALNSANSDQKPKIEKIFENHKKKLYHDFESSLATTPKLQLVHDLSNAGLKDMASKAMYGDYDF